MEKSKYLTFQFSRDECDTLYNSLVGTITELGNRLGDFPPDSQARRICEDGLISAGKISAYVYSKIQDYDLPGG